MRADIRILHLASFTGNVGDNANHLGFRPWFEQLLAKPCSWHELEIREFYWRRRQFDASFVELVNEFDFLVVGGGNYFELWVDDSHTGTSIDISQEHLAEIKIPIFFNALGVDAGQGTSAGSLQRFERFLSTLLSSDQYLVTVRNDGAQRTLQRNLPAEIADRVAVLPDGGFFAEFATRDVYFPGKKVVGLNLACDMGDIRFAEFSASNGQVAFCGEIAKTIEEFLSDEDIALVMFPHIYSDLRVLTDVVYEISDPVRRTRVAVAPYCVGPAGAERVFGGYRSCDLIVGMRFHANVCPIGMGIPTIGMVSYPQIKYLYEELGIEEGCMDVSRPGFANALSQRVTETLASPAAVEAKVAAARDRVQAQRDSVSPLITDWLDANST